VKKVKIFSLIVVAQIGQYLITLEEINGTKLIPVWIGPAEGMAITAVINNDKFPRPLTHDLMATIINNLNAKLESVIITDLKDDTFYADMKLAVGKETISIDCRPSDSIALALRCNAPIYVEDRVFKKCPDIHKPITGKEVEDFKKTLENLTPEDFFKGKREK